MTRSRNNTTSTLADRPRGLPRSRRVEPSSDNRGPAPRRLHVTSTYERSCRADDRNRAAWRGGAVKGRGSRAKVRRIDGSDSTVFRGKYSITVVCRGPRGNLCGRVTVTSNTPPAHLIDEGRRVITHRRVGLRVATSIAMTAMSDDRRMMHLETVVDHTVLRPIRHASETESESSFSDASGMASAAS